MKPQNFDLFQTYDSQSEQFRLTLIQSYNWGTFHGLHEFPIAREGFLFSGPSGSGKSTILDGHAAMMTPPRWVKFNVAAARDADRSTRDRNVVSYVRGAWAQQSGTTGEALSQFLRPDTTWSALAETYSNEAGQVVVLVSLYWIRGKSTAHADVRKVYMVFDEAFDIRALESFQRSDFDLRKLKAEFPHGDIHEDYTRFQERFRQRLGIENELALRLLHKAQSAKNLGELNTFLRDYMLDVPETFEKADALVAEFSELSAAHQAVVAAREQLNVLQPAHDKYAQQQLASVELESLAALKKAQPAYEEQLKAALLESTIQAETVKGDGIAAELEQAAESRERAEELLSSLREERYQNGGGQLEQLSAQQAEAERHKGACQERRNRAAAAAHALGHPMPNDPRGYADLVALARAELDDADTQRERLESNKYELKARERELGKQFKEVLAEIDAMEANPSNIPANRLALRNLIVRETGIPVERLPFAGELIQVKPECQEWEGAIERVLEGLAVTLLVEEADYADFSAYLNGRNLKDKLVYLRMQPRERQARPVSANSLVLKLDLAKCSQREWLTDELRERFDYECTEDMASFRRARKAVTREGQTRTGAKHTKDDRYSLNDPKRKQLGFDNKAKLALFKQEARDLGDQVTATQRALTQALDATASHQQRQRHCQSLADLSWAEIDLGALLEKVHQLQTRIEQLKANNSALASLETRITAQDGLVKDLRNKENELCVELASLEKLVQSFQVQLDGLRPDLLGIPIEASLVDVLDQHYETCSDGAVNLANLSRVSRQVDKLLTDASVTQEKLILTLTAAIENHLAEFNRRWPAESGGLDPVMASVGDYFAKLERLRADNLPQFEERFMRMLQDQSDQNVTLLHSQLKRGRADILERLDLVNESLKSAPYNAGTHLVIDPMERNLPEVKEFQLMLKAAVSNSFGTTPAQAETRFKALSTLVTALSGQDPQTKAWRDLVLDVRQHVEFRARELDVNQVEVEVYMSGAGKSGGQKQKLAATILAAALRYQLGGPDRTVPRYSTVVMDEAFDQADAEFTAMAMNIFKTFGFQLVVATPMKSVMAMEPYIEGACLVSISERKFSARKILTYDTAKKRLVLNSEDLADEAALT